MLLRWKKKQLAACVSRPWGGIVKQNKSFWDVFFFFFFILWAHYQQQPCRLCVCLRVCARLGGGGWFPMIKVLRSLCSAGRECVLWAWRKRDPIYIQTLKKIFSNIIPPYGHHCKGILNQRSGGGKKNIYRNAEKYSREQKENTQTKSKQPRGIYLNPVPFMVVLIWTNIVLCLWIKKIMFQGFFCSKSSVPGHSSPCDVVAWQWTWATTMDDIERIC